MYPGKASEKKWSMKISREEENQNWRRPFRAQGHSSMSRDVEVNSMTRADNYNPLGLEGATEEHILYFCLSFWDQTIAFYVLVCYIHFKAILKATITF